LTSDTYQSVKILFEELYIPVEKIRNQVFYNRPLQPSKRWYNANSWAKCHWCHYIGCHLGSR